VQAHLKHLSSLSTLTQRQVWGVLCGMDEGKHHSAVASGLTHIHLPVMWADWNMVCIKSAVINPKALFSDAVEPMSGNRGFCSAFLKGTVLAGRRDSGMERVPDPRNQCLDDSPRLEAS